MMLPILFKRTSKGQVQTWHIKVTDNYYWVEEGILNGKITKTQPHYCEEKNIGKINYTTGQTQANREALAEWIKKKKKGYVENVAEIDNTTFEKPMKGDKWIERVEEVIYPVYVSDKLNGVRLRIKESASRDLMPISTGGEVFYTIPHILAAVESLFVKYPTLVLDGEAYNHTLRKTLNRLIEIVSVQRKAKDVTPELLTESEKIVEFHVFDAYGFEGITKEAPYLKRFDALKKLLKPLKKYIKVVPVVEVGDFKTLSKMLAQNKKEGGEGLIIRWGECFYKHGRSKYLLKWKHMEDAEYEIIDLEEGNGDWAGCAKRAIMKLPKPTPDGETTFNSNILGDMAYLREMLKNKKKIIGEMGTIEYQQLSEYGVPQLPWLIAIRNYE